MAAIGKIRKRSGLLITVIGLSIVAFLLMDALQSSNNIGGGQSNVVGTVNGVDLTRAEFQTRLDQSIQNYITNRGQGGQITDEERTFIRNQTWENFVREVLNQQTYENLGVQVTATEKMDMISGANPHQQIVQSFTNPQTGQFDPQQVFAYVQTLDQDQPGDAPGTKRKRWLDFEEFLKNDRLNNKYTALLQNAFFTPSWKGELAYTNLTKSVSFEYTLVPYTQIADADIEVKDADIMSFMQKNKGKYEQEASRKIKFVAFDIIPSAVDSAKTRQWILDRQEEFATTEDDSAFVRLYSTRRFDKAFVQEAALAAKIKDQVIAAEAGAMVGPYVDNNSYIMTKVTAITNVPDSVACRHILFSFDELTTQAEVDAKRALVDSVFSLITEKNQSFDKLARQFSDGPTKTKGGDLGWAKPNQMVKPFNDAIFFEMKRGDVQKVVSQFGIHIVEVTNQKGANKAWQMAHLSKPLVPSAETEKNIYARASKFSGQNRTAAAFEATAEADASINVRTIERITKEDFSIPGMGGSQAREVVRWAFENEQGTVSKVFTVDRKQVVVLLDQVREKGLPNMDQARALIEVDVRKDLKAKQLMDQMKGKDMNAVSTSFDVTTKTSGVHSFTNAVLPGDGFEPEVVATALETSAGTAVGPIKGRKGVYMIKVTKNDEVPSLEDYSAYTNNAKREVSNVNATQVFDAAKKQADIEDNRFDFF